MDKTYLNCSLSDFDKWFFKSLEIHFQSITRQECLVQHSIHLVYTSLNEIYLEFHSFFQNPSKREFKN